eukprot:7867294-Pyramimonas_sp.AAC.1
MTATDSKTSDASACRIQRPELGMILELGLPNYYVNGAVGELQSSYRRQSRSIGGVWLLHREV